MITRRRLTKDAVVDAAIAVVEEDGVAELTLSRVARALGIKPPSLYNHVDSLDALRREVALRAIADLGRRLGQAAMGRAGRDALHAIAAEFRSYANANPGLYELSAQARPDDAEYAAASMRPVEPVLAILRSYDLDGAAGIHAARGLRAALHGFVSLEHLDGFGLDIDVDESFTWLVDHFATSIELSSRLEGAATAP